MEEVEEVPAYGDIAELQNDIPPLVRKKRSNAPKEEIAGNTEAYHPLRHVDGDRIHSDNREEEGLAALAPDGPRR